MLVCIFAASCRQTDTCEDDKKDENWEAIVDNASCSDEQKGEAYLALGGFDYFNFVTAEDPNLNEILNLNEDTWERSYNYFRAAVHTVIPVSGNDTDAEKTIYFIGSILSLYTHLIGNLDNSFDGEIESDEISEFTGTNINDESDAVSDGTNLETTGLIQFRYENQHYIAEINDPSDLSTWLFYNDDSADGIENSNLGPAEKLSLISGSADWEKINHVVDMKRLEDPFAGNAAKIQDTTLFFTVLVGLIDSVEQSLQVLGVDASDDSVAQLSDIKNSIDNGAQCSQIQYNPAIVLLQIFSQSLEKNERTDSDYSESNIIQMEDLTGIEDTTYPTIDALSVELNVKVRFLDELANNLAYWSDATPDVFNALSNISQIGTVDATGDGVISFSEIICTSETF